MDATPLTRCVPQPVVVKIGGSLLRQAPPRPLLAHLAALAPVVLVPGGGALADAVRDAQPHLGLSDKAAHAMALLSMEQMAHALADLEPEFVPCRTLGQLTQPRSRAALWFPAQVTLATGDIAESWDVTSDSLALWLAKRLEAPRLVLLKAPGAPVPATPPADTAAFSALAAAGLVDAAFPGLAQGFKGTIVFANADDSNKLNEALRLDATEDRP